MWVAVRGGGCAGIVRVAVCVYVCTRVTLLHLARQRQPCLEGCFDGLPAHSARAHLACSVPLSGCPRSCQKLTQKLS